MGTGYVETGTYHDRRDCDEIGAAEQIMPFSKARKWNMEMCDQCVTE